MSLTRVAELAGVSVATVSRVLNDSPHVSAATAKSVRRVMAQTQFKRQRARRRPAAAPGKKTTINLLVFGPQASRAAQPAFFEALLRGVSSVTQGLDTEMPIAFVASPDDLPRRVLRGKVDGLLLHGAQPSDQTRSLIQKIPAVWLMSNRQRPGWGDQVMPDNTGVGEIAADYLADRGHRRTAFVNLVWRSWFWETRARAFLHRSRQRGIEASIVPAEAIDLPPEARREPWRAQDVVEALLNLKSRPTGLFIGEDYQVPAIAGALQQQGCTLGRGKDFEIIACNNERIPFSTMGDMPATIDVQAEAIGRRGAQLLLSRLNGDNNDRRRELIEPVLVTNDP